MGCGFAGAARGLGRTVSMPGAPTSSSPRKKQRSAAGLLRPAGSAGVTKASPRSMLRSASARVRLLRSFPCGEAAN